MLVVSILGTGLIGSYTTVPAAEFSAGALAASETLEWISAALASVGIAVSVKELLKPRQADIEKDIGKHIDWDNYDWGDMLDSPAAQDQIDELDKTINKLYGNASAKWKEMYEKSLSPTPTPETSPDNPDPSPPVTVAPIDPDTVTPPDWETLRKTSRYNGSLLLGAATYWCLKEAVKGFWDDIIGKYTDTVYDEANFELLDGVNSHDSFPKFAGTFYHEYTDNSGYKDCYYCSMYVPENAEYVVYKTDISSGMQHWYFYDDNDELVKVFTYLRNIYSSKSGQIIADSMLDKGSVSGFAGINLSNSRRKTIANFNLPVYIGSKSNENLDKSIKKPAIWPSTDLKNDYDNNKSPSLPDTAPAPAIKIPSLDDLKDLQKKGNDASDDDRPSIILDWLKDHYTNPSTDPQPTTAPDPDPNPTTAPNPDPDPDPDPNPDPTTTPAVNPEPSTAPKPSGTPENPDDTDTDIDPDDYKTDLRLVFPFCIPFDLVHLIQAFEAEPEAPVFEFPVDIELNDPFAGSERSAKKIVDYHHTFELNMSDYEPVIKIFRIFEIIFFIIGLLLITRQQMIKG